MLKNSRKRILWRVVLIASLLSPLVLLSSNKSPWSRPGGLAMMTQELLFPFELAWHSSLDFVAETWEHYILLTETAKENTRLHSELTLLKTKLLDYDDKLQEISRLRKLVGFVQHRHPDYIVAEVISTTARPSFQSIRISKGEWDGVKIGMPVITGSGVVGRIIRVGKKFSDVHLLIDPNFTIDVLLQRNRVRGVLKGHEHHAILKMNRRAEIKIGDTFISSGIIGGFPKGLPVGRVIRIAYEADNISQTVTIEPWVDFDRIEEVVILNQHDPQLQKISETAGKEWMDSSFKPKKGG